MADPRLKKVGLDLKGKNVSRLELSVSPSMPDFVVDLLTGWLVGYAPRATFEDGQTLQFGWALLSCRVKGRTLTLLAPDMRTFPIQFVEDVTPALGAILEHRYVPESFDLDPDIPTLQQSAVVGEAYGELPAVMERFEPNAPHDSGWVFNCVRPGIDNNDPEKVRPISLYEAVLNAPHLLRFLSMPAGSLVALRGPAPEVFLHRRRATPAPGSYLAEKLAAERGG